jgi:hypothetical protein
MFSKALIRRFTLNSRGYCHRRAEAQETKKDLVTSEPIRLSGSEVGEGVA